MRLKRITYDNVITNIVCHITDVVLLVASSRVRLKKIDFEIYFEFYLNYATLHLDSLFHAPTMS